MNDEEMHKNPMMTWFIALNKSHSTFDFYLLMYQAHHAKKDKWCQLKLNKEQALLVSNTRLNQITNKHHGNGTMRECTNAEHSPNFPIDIMFMSHGCN